MFIRWWRPGQLQTTVYDGRCRPGRCHAPEKIWCLMEADHRRRVVLGRYGYELAIDCGRPTEYS